MHIFKIFPLIVLILIVSCKSNTTKDNKNIFKSDTLVIDNTYPELKAEEVLQVMEQLQVCTRTDTIHNLPPCTNKYFRIFKFNPGFKWDKGFLLEMRAGLFNTPVKQLLVVQKTFNKYKIVNQYLGFLIEQRTTESGYNDLLMGYEDPEIGIVAIKHVWQGTKYEPVDVEEINGYYVKNSLKDSINHLFIDNFNAGH